MAAAQALPQPQLIPRSDTAPATPYTLKAGTQRVLVDVVVTDKHGNPIHGLKTSDFSIAEDGKAQAISDFDEHSALTPAEAAAVAPLPALPAGEYTNFVRVPQSSAVTVILVDRLNTAQVDQVYLQQQLLKYLDHARADTRTAIFGLTDHLLLLQGFTSDPAVLRTFLTNHPYSKASVLRDNALGGAASSEDLQDTINNITRLTSDSTSSTGIQAFQAQYQSFQKQLQGKYTLDALNSLARSLSGIPGRKNLIWFSGNFPSAFFPGDNNDATPFAQFAGLEDEFRQTINLLTTAQVAIYPVDAQGLRGVNNNAAGVSNPQYGSIRSSSGSRGLAIANDTLAAESEIGTEHLGMKQIAYDTGGKAYINSNDLADAVSKAIANGSNYYTLAYVPPTGTGGEKDTRTFRQISVKLLNGNSTLSYRHGYYTDRDAGKAGKPSGSPETLAQSSLRRALLVGGPTPTELTLKVRLTPTDKGGEAKVAAGNRVNPDSKVPGGPYQQFQVGLAASARSIVFRRTSDQRYHAELALMTYVYDRSGTLVNAQSSSLTTSYDPKTFLEVMRTGLPAVQQISVPDHGDYTLRIAFEDKLSGKVGAVEIPIEQVRGLPVLAESQPPPVPATPPAATPQP